MKKFTLEYQERGIKLVPQQDFEDLEEIMIELGDYDIVSCNEINATGDYWVVGDGKIYELRPQNQRALFEGKETELPYVTTLKEEIDEDNPDHVSFMKWYGGGK